MTDRRTGRWRGIVAVVLFAVAVGVLAKRPLVLLAGVVGVAYAVYPHVVPAPSVDVSIDRRVSDGTPAPGDEVEVTVTVTNHGSRTLWDLRVVDGVPGMLAVTEGTARHCAVLRPGASTTFSYAVEAAFGTHAFEPATVVARDPAGATEVETEVAVETTLECATAVPEAPLRRRAGQLPGDLVTDEGGSGIEFHGVREYRPGDPPGRIDWRRYARAGDLVTVEFAEERSTSVVLLVDAREPAYRGRAEEPHAVAHGVAAASGLVPAVAESRNRVGVAVVGREFGWLPPGAGADHVARARRLLATHPACSLRPPEEDDPADAEAALAELRARVDRESQVVLLSPLTDDFAESVASRLAADGHAVTVVCPDVTGGETAGARLAGVERDHRVGRLRAAGVAVIDWSTDEPLGATIIRARERGIA